MLCNFDSICRLCTNETTDLQPISDIVLTKQVLQCTSVQIVEGDGLPDTVCQDCLKKLSNAYEFRLQCQQSDTHLRQQLSYEALDDTEIPDDMQIFQCQQSVKQSSPNTSNDVEVKDEDQLLFDIVYKDATVQFNPDPECAQMLIVDGSDVTTIKRVKHGKAGRRRKSDANTSLPDVDDNSTTWESEVLRYPKIRMKRKIKRKNQNKNKRYFTKDIKAEETEIKVEQDTDRNKKSCIKKLQQCQVCGKLCRWIKPHMLTHTGVRSFKCEYCEKAFVQLSHYRRHINIHTGNKPFACTMCDKKFHDPSLKISHIISAHTKERNYKCDICEKAFGHYRTLAAHKKIHSQDRKHLCSICNKAFLTKYGLKKHFRIHTGEKPYKCDFCDKTFTSSGNIQSHMRTHTRERPYTCDICQMKFSYRSVLNSHLKIHQK